MAQLLALLILFNIRPLMMAFGAEPEVVAFGVAQSRIAAPFYFLPAMSHCMAGILRGLGKAVVPMLVMLVCWCVIRVSYLTVALHFRHDIRLLYAAYPITWALSAAALLFCLRRIRWTEERP